MKDDAPYAEMFFHVGWRFYHLLMEMRNGEPVGIVCAFDHSTQSLLMAGELFVFAFDHRVRAIEEFAVNATGNTYTHISTWQGEMRAECVDEGVHGEPVDGVPNCKHHAAISLEEV